MCIYEMITQSLTFVTSYSHPFFFVMRTFKISSLNNFQIYNTLWRITVSILYLTFLDLSITTSLYLLTTFTHFTYLDSELSIQRKRINERTCKNILEQCNSHLHLKVSSHERPDFCFSQLNFQDVLQESIRH